MDFLCTVSIDIHTFYASGPESQIARSALCVPIWFNELRRLIDQERADGGQMVGRSLGLPLGLPLEWEIEWENRRDLVRTSTPYSINQRYRYRYSEI